MTDKALWYASRGTGVVLLVLLTVVVLLGVLSRAGRPLPGLPRFATVGLHRNISLLALAFLTVHILGAVLDPYARTGWLSTLVPYTSGYRPLWVGLGAVALDLILALTVTSLLRARLGQPAWKAVHWLGYAVWPVALAHSLGSGTDIGQIWLIALDVGCGGTVLAAMVWRLGAPRPAPVLP